MSLSLPMQELDDWGTISRGAIRSGQTNGEGWSEYLHDCRQLLRLQN